MQLTPPEGYSNESLNVIDEEGEYNVSYASSLFPYLIFYRYTWNYWFYWVSYYVYVFYFRIFINFLTKMYRLPIAARSHIVSTLLMSQKKAEWIILTLKILYSFHHHHNHLFFWFSRKIFLLFSQVNSNSISSLWCSYEFIKKEPFLIN